MIHAIHIEFMGGGEPYFKWFNTAREVRHELHKWRKLYHVTGVTTRIGIYFGTAIPKTI